MQHVTIIPTADRPSIAQVTSAVDAKIEAEAQAEVDRLNNALLDRKCGSHEVVMMTERQAGRANMTRHGAWVQAEIERLLQGLFDHEHIVILPPFMAGAQGVGFMTGAPSMAEQLAAAGRGESPSVTQN